MFFIYKYLPLIDAFFSLTLLAAGVLRQSKTLFIGSFAALLVSVVSTLEVSFCSEAGGILILYGVACVCLSYKRTSEALISRLSLRTTGAYFILIGILASFAI